MATDIKDDLGQGNVIDLDELSIKFGKLLANPPPGEEVVISGIAGEFPDSGNVEDLRDSLFNKKDLISDDCRRWERGHPEIPQRVGKMPFIEKFDAGFFGVHHRQSNTLDPMVRKILEKVMEAIFDAGLHPSDLEGTNTGVFIGAAFGETEKTWFFDKLIPNAFAVTGCLRSMIARRISYFFKLKGPAYICDTACSSSLFAVEHAFKAIRTGQCDKAIVGGSNLILHPYVSLQFSRLGVLSMDGRCKVFDNAASGYVRSEAVIVLILERAKDSKRVYATMLHAKSNNDGYKDSGITYPLGDMQVHLYKEFYEECHSVKPTDINFIEAHGTGTRVGDPEEVQGLGDFFLKEGQPPLLVGSVKSNLGHTEPTAGVCSITKSIIAFESGYIPPNINYKSPNPAIKPLEEGKIKVVVEKVRFPDNRGLIGINSFGFGGGNCHVLLKHNTKEKVHNDQLRDNIPRLVCVSGRNKEAVECLLNDVGKHMDTEQIALLYEGFRKNVQGYQYRGYSLISKSGEITRSINYNATNTPTLVVCFGVIDKTIREQAKEFFEITVFAGTVQRIHDVLQRKGFDIMSTLLKTTNLNILETLLVNMTLHLGFAEILNVLQVLPDKTFGVTKDLSLGTLICAYCDGALTFSELIDCVYAVAQAMHSVSSSPDNKCENIDVLLSKNVKAATQLQQSLTKILGKPRRLSGNVIFDSSPSEISSTYLTNSFNNFKILKEVKYVIDKNITLFEIGNGSISEIIKKDMKNANKATFVNNMDGIKGFLTSIGRLYELGFQPQISNLYPKVKFPVSRGTPMIAPKIKWNHTKDWYVTRFNITDNVEVEERTVGVLLKEPHFTFIEGHNIDGRTLFPATGYLFLVWETLGIIHSRLVSDMKVVFENCKFKRACTVPTETKIKLTVIIQLVSGNFEVIEGDSVVVTGRIKQAENNESDLELNCPSRVTESTLPFMTTKDIYKELRLRGYNYKGQFRALQTCDISAQVGKIAWDGNWITFMDSMLQMKILQEDTRLLYVPISIQKLTIDAKKHLEHVTMHGEQPHLPVYAPNNLELIRSGAIEIRGLIASSIAKRKYRGIPVLEKYIFIPNEGKLTTEQAVRVDVQILLENLRGIKVKVVELIDDATSHEAHPLGEIIHNALADQPLIQPEITILSKVELGVKTVKVEDKQLLTEVDCSLVVGSKILQRTSILHVALGCIKQDAFILSREPLDFDVNSCNFSQISVITSFDTDVEKLILFRKFSEYKTPYVVKITSNEKRFEWLPKLKDALQKNENILICAQGDPMTGALGMFNCLRQESGSRSIRLMFIPDSAPEFDIDHPFYTDQLQRNLSINIFKDNKWGSYRHLLLEEGRQIQVDHCYLNTLILGDLSSVTWFEGPLKANSKVDPEQQLAYVYYAALNFRDVMTASGKINVDSITRDRRDQECVQGFEFSGRTQDGRRVMGFLTQGACASLVAVQSITLWEVPDHWSLKDACTVPVVYLTCLVSLLMKGEMKRGDVILIHSGAGGVGLAAITLALDMGCTVYTTVGSQEKRDYLKKIFPQIKDKHIANSRDLSFEKHIMQATNGRGVDIVLNSLAEEKLMASVRCLARGGRFIEIGKYDLAMNNSLNLLLLEREASFHGFMLDAVLTINRDVCTKYHSLFQEKINSGVIRPLGNTTFRMDQAEEAFRYMTTGKHMGKVLIEIRQEEQEEYAGPSNKEFFGCPRYYCDSNKTYIICGGLGGFGLELADWLTLRGCKKLILVSRTGVKTGYQAYRISIFKSYGCIVNISTEDITTKKGCENLIEVANKLGPVHAIFNLAVVLRDAVLENQTEETYEIAFKPKAYATQHLDEVSRLMCPELRDFVVFSSVSCGRGNAGQTNYGMANSVMERICEKRRQDGYPAIAIEWGAVGEVGLVAELRDEAVELEIGGTLQQKISNCLQVMDVLLRQNESAVVSSMVVAEKRAGSGGADNIVDAIANILGVKDLKLIPFQSTLAEVGMDSMTAVEIKQTLEREFEVFLTAQDIKNMTFARLMEIQAEKLAENQTGETNKERPLFGLDMIIRLMGNPTNASLPFLTLNNHLSGKQNLPTCVIFPGIEGIASTVEPLYKHLDAELILLQFPFESLKDTIEGMASDCMAILEEKLQSPQPFFIVCYSYGGIIALETVRMLEERGYCGTVFCIDTAPDYLQALTKIVEIDVEDKFQVNVIVQLMSLHISYEVIVQHLDPLMRCDSFEERLKLGQEIVGEQSLYSPEYARDCAIMTYTKLKALRKWNPTFKLKSNVILFKPTLVSLKLPDEDYGLSKICQNPVEVQTFDGNHVTVLENPEVGIKLNEMLQLLYAGTNVIADKDMCINMDKIQVEVPIK